MGEAGLAQEVYHLPQVDARPLFAVKEESVPPIASIPIASVIAEMPGDRFDRARAERLVRNAQSLGAAALAAEVNQSDIRRETLSRYPSLMHAIQEAAAGDPEARKFVEINGRTLCFEITLKSGHVTNVPIYIDGNGKPTQYGQVMEDVYINALMYASGTDEIYPRTLAEARNGMRIESAHRRRALKDNYLVIFSRYTDTLDDDKAADSGFFAPTKSCSIQAITEVAENELVQQSAFVAGVKQKGAERHDIRAVEGIGRRLGVNFEGKSDAETIDMAILVPKRFMKNGVIDLVKMYDEILGDTFFGEAKPTQEYLPYLQKCIEREKLFEPTIQQAVEKLISESHQITDPEMATERLHKLIEGELVDRSIVDKSINPSVFGAEAEQHIIQGRISYEKGDMEQVEVSRNEARRTAKSTGCPAARNQNSNNKDKDGDANSEDDKSDAPEANKRCVIVTKNCYCCKYNLDGSVRPTRMTVQAFHDARGTLRCMRFGCGAWIAQGGKHKNIGDIAKRAEQREKIEAKSEEADATVLLFPKGGRSGKKPEKADRATEVA